MMRIACTLGVFVGFSGGGGASSSSTLGPASISVFDGEDTHKKERVGRQAAEVNAWATAQLQEQSAAAQSRRQSEL